MKEESVQEEASQFEEADDASDSGQQEVFSSASSGIIYNYLGFC